MNIIISKGWYDKNFVENWSIGFEELKKYAANFVLKKVSKICAIEENTILFLAENLKCKNKVSSNFYTGLEYAASGIQNMRSIFILMAITGNIDNEGGLYIDNYPLDTIKEYSLNTRNIPIGAKKYPLFYALTGKAQFVEFPNAVLKQDPYAVKGIIIVGGSPIISYPSVKLWEQVYNKLDFIAVVDRFMTEECKYADVVLPACTFYETTSFKHYKDRVCLREKSIEPVGESRGDVYIFKEIAKRLGYGSKFPSNEKDMIRRVFRDTPDILDSFNKGEDTFLFDKKKIVYKKYEKGLLRKDGCKGFPTPSGKFEIKSFLLEKYGYEGLPKYKDPYDYKFLKDISDNYPLTLITGSRGLVRENSQYIEIERLNKYDPIPRLDINIEDAKNRNIKDGDRVLLKTMYGKLPIIAHVTTAIGKGIIHVPHGGGKYTENSSWRKTNVNSILNIDNRDEVSGFVQLKSSSCEVTLP